MKKYDVSLWWEVIVICDNSKYLECKLKAYELINIKSNSVKTIMRPQNENALGIREPLQMTQVKPEPQTEMGLCGFGGLLGFKETR